MAIQHQWEAWPKNAVTPGNWRAVDPARPWVPSPESQPFPLPPEHDDPKHARIVPPLRQSLPIGQRSSRPQQQREEDPLRRKPSRLSIRYWLDWLGSTRRRGSPDEWPSLHGERRVVTPAEWKAYGYWARPQIGTVTVRNATPPPVLRTLSPPQVESVMRSLAGPDGRGIPENWIARLEHPSLPPRPPLWPTPPSSPAPPPPPPPAELQLNPFLAHRRTGKPPLLLDVRMTEQIALLGEVPPIPEDPVPGLVLFNAAGPNGAQAATHPGVGALNVGALADDPLGAFPWPFVVLSHHAALPVTVQDVLRGVLANFHERVAAEELAALTATRREQVHRAYWQRVQELRFDEADGVRRVDYLGDRYMFRGLEPVPGEEGFMIFFGPP